MEDKNIDDVTDPVERRKLLKQKLRNKINHKSNTSGNQQMHKNIKRDPTGALLSMGVEDPELLASAKLLLTIRTMC